MIIDELNKKIADIESLANDKTSTIESKVSDLTDGLLMVADAVDIIPEMIDEKITAITKEFSTIKDSVSKVKAQKGDNGRDGIDGLDGLNGRDGKDGSPDKPKDIADKLNTMIVKGTGGIQVPVGTTGERVDVQGMIRYNTTTSKFEGYDGSAWQDFH